MKTFAIEQFFIKENSERNITNILGYPPVVSSILQRQFGKNSFLIAKWFKEYRNIADHENDKWFNIVFMRPPISSTSSASVIDYIKRIKKLDAGEDEYKKFLKDEGYYVDDEEIAILFSDQDEMDELKRLLVREMSQTLLSDVFFSNTFIEGIQSGEISDVKPYKGLSFDDAVKRFRSKKIFDDKTVIKSYENGFTWRDVGKRCELTAKAMRNCGSAGVMSFDEDKTLLVLFDSNNNTHAIVTYSPNEKRISSEEGIASSELKEKYHDYVLDLAKHLGVKFDFEKSRSKLLSVKYRLESIIDPGSMNLIFEDSFDKFIEFSINGEKYITNSYSVIKKKDMSDFINYFKENEDTFKKYFDDQSDEMFYIKTAFSNRNFPSNLKSKVVKMQKFIDSIDISESTSIYKLFFHEGKE